MISAAADRVSVEHPIQVVEELAAKQIDVYRVQPKEIVSHYNHERSVVESYRGRQLLELLQNADDSLDDETRRGSRLLFRLVGNTLIAANTGRSFDPAGIESLVISDTSPKQLRRSRCIGNKGLGFRSVLSWSAEPMVLSGPHAIAFAAEHAEECVLRLAEELPGLAQIVGEWREAGRNIPAPTMRFPFSPEDNSPLLTLAHEVMDEGYDTVIALPLQLGSLQETVRREVLDQLHQVSGNLLLFCYHLEHLSIETGDAAIDRSWTLKREGDEFSQTVRITEGSTGETRQWRIRRRMGRLPGEVVDQDIRDTPQYEIAVAVPEDIRPAETNHLCVFFPTEDVLPTPLLAHATLATNESRKRLIPHAANQFVLSQLASLMAEVAEEEAQKQHERGLILLSGAEKCDPELVQLGFWHALLAAACDRNLVPCIDKTVRKASEVRLAGHRIWYTIATSETFPELLAEMPNGEVTGFATALGIRSYSPRELAERLERAINPLSPKDSGAIVGALLRTGQLPYENLPAVLRDVDGRVIPVSQTVFLPPEGEPVALPDWAVGISFLHREYTEACRSSAGASTGRDLRLLMEGAGYEIEEYQFESLARRLEDVAYRDSTLDSKTQAARCRAILAILFALTRGQMEAASVRTDVSLLTDTGLRRSARSCYLSASYPNGRLVDVLYRPLGTDEFVADPTALGLEDAAIEEVEHFLRRLGVADKPRMTRIQPYEFGKVGLGDFVQTTLDEQAYPIVLDAEVASSDEVRAMYWSLRIEGIEMPDRFAALLQCGDVEPLISYLSAEGAYLILT
jgi:hypothetical protein